MLGDNERSNAYAAEQRRLVRAAVAAEVLTFTPFWRDAAGEAGLNRPTSVADLRALPPRPLSAMGPPDALVLRPSTGAVRKSGPRPLRRRLRRARLGRGRATAARRILDPLYKPVHWIIDDETPVGCTEADMVRLAELGRRSLDLAGVTPNDAIVGLVPPGPTLSAWQLSLGAREASVPLAGLAPSTSLEAVTMLGPTVLAGRPVDLLRVLGGISAEARSSVATVLVVMRTPLPPDERRVLEAAAGDKATLVELWSPPGVRALWAQCRGGEGVHTWPSSELVEVCGPDGDPVAAGEEGELVWTGLGWRGTVLVRLATGVRGRLVEGRCGTCGRTTPRVLDAELIAGADGLDRDEPPVGRPKATGGIESVRTVREPARPKEPAKASGRPSKQSPGKGRTVAVPAPSAAAGPPAAPVEAVPREDLPGTVRAVARDDAASGGAAPSRADRIASTIGEVDHLPPVPDVGPDATSDRPAAEERDPWLPDTGEIDAWPAPVLASVDGLAAWQVEHRRRRGRDEVVVHLALAPGAQLGEVLVSLERSIGATQYVVRDEAEVVARVAAAAGRRVVDRRGQGTANGGGPSPSAAPATSSRRDG